MPGNEVGDSVHNFFAQENISQGQHNSQSLDGNLPVLNNIPWAGSQRPAGVLSSNAKNYILQQPDHDRGQIGNPLHGQHSLNFLQSTPRPEFAKSQSQSQHSTINGFMYGNQFYQSREDETNFLAEDTDSDQRNLTSRGMSIYESPQVSGPESRPKSSVRSETSGSPASFDFFAGQQEMNNQQLSVLQSLQRQQSGLNDIQQLQQQVMFMKMQELQRQQGLQRQQHVQQVDVLQPNMMNQIPSFTKQASGSQSFAMISGSLNSDVAGNHWANELGNANWSQRHSSVTPGSSNGLVFSPNHSKTQRVADIVPQQVEQSLYGVPVSSSRDSVNQYQHGATDNHSVQQLATFGNSIPGNQYNVFPKQVNTQDGISVARQRFQAGNSLEHFSGQSLDAINMDNLQQVNSLHRNSSLREFLGRQEMEVPRETLQEKTDTVVESSQNDVALDPTEERILFGSDDNIWTAFGKSPNVGGDGSNPFDGAGDNGFPSIQSGSWSALMQSAAAETTSGDVGLQEEWSGLHFQNTDLPSGSQHPLASNDGGKQPMHLTDHSPPMVSSLSTRAAPSSHDVNTNKNYQSVLGFQQFGGRFSSESGPRLHSKSSQWLDQSFEEGGRYSNGIPMHKLVAGGSQIRGNAPHSLHAETKSNSSPWTQENSGSSQLSNKPNGWNVLGSEIPYGGAALMAHGAGNSSQNSQGNDQKQVMHRKLFHGGTLWKPNADRDSKVELEQLKSSVGNAQLNNAGFSSNNAAMLPDSTNIRTGEGSSRFLPNIYETNYWKNVDPGGFRANEMVGSSLHENKNVLNKEVSKGYEMENSDTQENSNDSYRSNFSHHTSTGAPKENLVSDASDSRTVSAGKQKASSQITRKNSAPRKFQYHPMGNLEDDQELSHATKQPMHSQAMSHLGQSKFFGQVPKASTEMGKGQSPDLQRSPKGFNEALSQGVLPGPLPNTSAPLNRSIDMQAPNKASPPSQNMLELFNKVDQSREHGALMHVGPSELNAPPEMPQAETSDGSASRLQRSQSTNSQGFGLQLGPPSQRHPIANHRLPSQSSLQMVSSFHSSHTSSEMGQKPEGQLVPASFVHSRPPPTERSQGELNAERSGVPVQVGNETSHYKVLGNISTFSPGSPYPGGHLQKHDTGWRSGQTSRPFEKHTSHSLQKEDPRSRPTTSQSAETSLPDEAESITNNNNVSYGNISQKRSANFFPEKISPQASGVEPVLVNQPSSVTGHSVQGSAKALPNMWANFAAQQHLLGSQFRKMSSQFPMSFQANIANSSSSGSLNQGDHDANKGGNFLSELGADLNSQGMGSEEERSVKKITGQEASSENSNLVQKLTESQGKEPVVRTASDGSPANSVSKQTDIEAFGRSLKPNNLLQPNYSLLNQMQAMKNTENDPSQRVLKRMKGPDSGLVSQFAMGQSNDPNATTEAALVPSHASSPSRDSSLLNLSATSNNVERNMSSEQPNVVSQGMFGFGQNISQSDNNATYNKVDHSKVSPQMAPSWFNQYGTLKNGQILPMYDAHRTASLRIGEHHFALAKPSSSLHTLNSMEQTTAAAAAADINQVGIAQQNSSSPSLPVEHFSSHILPTHISGQNTVISRTKKRKSDAFIPWSKEVSQGPRDLQTMSLAELDWAKAENRLTEKAEEDVDLMEDGQLMSRPRRRLILTTQLMQQLFRAPPAPIISMDANSSHDSVAYFTSRLALGDACGSVSLANSESNLSHDGINERSKPSGRVDDQHLSKAVKEFSARARKLEDDLLRVDKRASVLGLILDCQDLEKFSVINRFAKFHGRGQAESAETGSSSDAATNSQNPFLQRYVTPLPLPRSLPTRVQCHSL